MPQLSMKGDEDEEVKQDGTGGTGAHSGGANTVLLANGEHDVMAVPLAPRELEILNHIKRGKSNGQIGLELTITEQTVKNMVSRVLRKLAARDRAHAVYIAMKWHLIY